jgi:signal transduction histidine kinase
MNIYSIYQNPQEQDINPIIIKQGFSLWAFIFNFAWAFYNRMWAFAILGLLGHFIIISNSSNVIASAVNVAMLFVFGFLATEIEEYYANKKGFKLSDVVLAKDTEDAELKFFVRLNLTN